MWKKHVLLPLWLGLVTPVPALNAYNGAPSPSKALYFIENKGQVTDQYLQVRRDLDFKLAAGNGLNIFIGSGKIEYQWTKAVASATTLLPVAQSEEDNEIAAVETYELYRMDVRLIGSNPNAAVVTEGQLSYFERYFLSWVNTANSNAGVVAHAYTKITYKNIYPHIDWVFYFNAKGQLEHDFVVHPGGKVSDIQIQYSGADRVALNPDGSLTAFTTMGSATEQTPYAYNKQTNQVVTSSFKLSADHILSFDIGSYTGTLVIDPVLEWGTYFGGAANDECFALTTDQWGDVYMAGSTTSTDNIATTGAFQTTFAGGTTDAFLSKWNKEGHLLWATYLGGTNVDAAKGLGCDTAGNVYIGGNTNSRAGIATANAFQDTLHGGNADAFIVKLDSSGQRIWGTYFGGINNEAHTSFDLTTDEADHIYITGNTQSPNLPVTPGVHQSAISPGIEVFVAQFNTEGQLGWSTFYGGPGTEQAYGIAVDKAMNSYITGYTQSVTGIATSGATQGIIGGGQDAYLAQFSPTGRLNWATYLGGEATERGYTIAAFDDKIAIGGVTNSATGIASLKAYQKTKNSGDECFMALFDHTGNLEWSTYYGGEGAESITGITLNSKSIYILGQSNSKNNIASTSSFQPDPAGITDAFAAKFDWKGERIWATYYGGTGTESGNAITLTQDLNIFIGGRSNSGAGIATANAAFPILSAGYDAFLVRINDCDPPAPLSSITGDTVLCSGSSVQYSIEGDSLASNYQWLLPDGWEGTSDSSTIIVTVGDESGIIQVYALSACGGVSDTQSVKITVLPLPQPEIQNQNGILSTTKVYATYQWLWNENAIDGATQATYIPSENGHYQVRVANPEGCEGISDSVLLEHLSISAKIQGTGIQIYPNPVDEVFILQSDYPGSIQVYSLEGKTVMGPTLIQKGQNKINVNTWSAGFYLLRLQTDKGGWHLKLSKQ